jgi:hypothetical protein
MRGVKSSYAVYSITPARPKSKNLRFLMIANTQNLGKEKTDACKR